MITIFLTSYKAVLIPEVPIFEKTPLEKQKDDQIAEPKKKELRDTLSLKPLVALALSRDLEDSLKRQAVSLLHDVSRNGATHSLKVFFISLSFPFCLSPHLSPIARRHSMFDLFTTHRRTTRGTPTPHQHHPHHSPHHYHHPPNSTTTTTVITRFF